MEFIALFALGRVYPVNYVDYVTEQRLVIPAELGRGLYMPFYRDHSGSFPVLDLPTGGGVGASPGAMRGDDHWILEGFGYFH